LYERLKFQKLHDEARLPRRGSERAAGLDLCSVENCVIHAGERAAIRTGLAVSIPEGFYGRIAPRSGLAVRHGLDVLAGVIDSDYRGEILCALINHGHEDVEIKVGMRVAQLILEAIIRPEAAWAEELEETVRGAAGFGSTGQT
jgi:dUTP pyrophosphatase